MMEEQLRWQLRLRSEDVSACCLYLEERLPIARESLSAACGGGGGGGGGGSCKRSVGQNQQSKRNREDCSSKS
jgi:hypothetical protein